MIFRALVSIILAASLLSSCGNRGLTCDEDAAQVALARSLPQERLLRLFADAQAAVARHEKGLGWKSADVWVPAEFADLDPAKVTFSARRISIVMKHCRDHGVFLDVVMPADERASIVLRWGEAPHTAGQQVLWQRP